MQSEKLTDCCTATYENELVRLLLGESWHPGGLHLTTRLAELAQIKPSDKVIDVGSGNGASALHLARERGCHIVGVEASAKLVEEAQRDLEPEIASLVSYKNGDAEHLPVRDAEFTVGIAECSLCLLSSEARALTELRRVLTPDGRLAISDMVVEGELPESLRELTARVFCVAEGRSLKTKLNLMERAGFAVDGYELRPDALVELIDAIRRKLFFAEILCGIGRLRLKSADIRRANHLLSDAEKAVEDGILDYCIIRATKVQAVRDISSSKKNRTLSLG